MTRVLSTRIGSAILGFALFAAPAATPTLAGSCSGSGSVAGGGAGKPAVMKAAYGSDQKTVDIVDTAIGAGNFTTLAAALQAAGLVDTLKGAGPFTVFAPTDEAFAKLPKGTVEALLKDPQKLASVLTYHVVPGKVTAADVAQLKSAKTVQGSTIKIDTRSGVQINDANVVQADVMASNGVIHVIDKVILPPA